MSKNPQDFFKILRVSLFLYIKVGMELILLCILFTVLQLIYIFLYILRQFRFHLV